MTWADGEAVWQQRRDGVRAPSGVSGSLGPRACGPRAHGVATLSAPLQLACLLEWGQTFAFHVVCREYELERPKSVVLCQHGIDRRFCESKVR